MRVVILGAGGHGQVVADILLRMHERTNSVEPIGYLDDRPALFGQKFLGLPVLGSIAALGSVSYDAVVIAVGDNATRRRLYEQLRSNGIELATARHPDSVIAPDVTVGPGTMVCAGAVIGTSSVIGSNCIVNTSCSIDHHNRIGDHVHIAPGVHLGGEVVVSDGAMVGIGSTVLPRSRIGAWSLVGAGSLVLGDVPEAITVTGKPARPMRRRLQAVRVTSRNMLAGAYSRLPSERARDAD
jgi:sugar O-acyltransferase (sialic acid O-acetyltransferase NeuD family)